MAEKTEIAWTDSTANLWWGCTEVHAGCDHCYAREFSRNRTGKDVWKDQPRALTKGVWRDLAKWQREAPAFRAEHGRTRRVFVGSMMDIFEKPMPAVTWSGEPAGTTEAARQRFFNEVVPACPDLTFLLLTKRPGNVAKYVPASWLEPGGWPPYVWVGTSVVDQGTAETLIPQLLRLPGPLFLSMEPLLGPVDLTVHLEAMKLACLSSAFSVDVLRPAPVSPGILWIIVGGESGTDARPMHPDWARGLRDQAARAGLAFLFKQWGEWLPAEPGEATHGVHVRDGQMMPAPRDVTPEHFPSSAFMRRVGKKAAGHLLDGQELYGFPDFAERIQ